MSKPRKKSIGCRVVWTTTIDHPERRNDTYPKVDPGTKVQYTRFTENCKSAAALYKDLIDGQYDTSSDFTSSARVDRVWSDEGRRPGTVKPWATRARLAGMRKRKGRK